MRLIRDGIVTFNGKIATLRRFKDDVKEVVQNYECGINIENYNDIKVGDVIECYYMEEVKAAMPTIMRKPYRAETKYRDLGMRHGRRNGKNNIRIV